MATSCARARGMAKYGVRRVIDVSSLKWLAVGLAHNVPYRGGGLV